LHWLGLMRFGALISDTVQLWWLMNFAILHRWPAAAGSGWFDVAALMIFLTARGRLFNYPKP
jgi:hypothetical protein